MKNKKIIIIMMVIITILLATTILGIILNITGVNILKNAQNKSIQIASIENTSINQNANIENINYNNLDKLTSLQDIQELRTASASGSDFINILISRSEIDRQKKNTIHINLSQTQQDDYEEIITYIKLEDVKLSFNMDVSKTTGLSKEDFVTLVQNMKCDKTGILEKNAAWIWECCQKYSVNEIFVLGICGIESAWCSAPQHQNTHNYSSMMKGGKLISYASDEAGFEAMIKLLGQKYLSPNGALYHGATITGVGTKYCNTTTWPPKVFKCMKQVFN